MQHLLNEGRLIMPSILCDVSSERAVLSCILRQGEDAYIDVADILDESVFTIDSNQYIYNCIKHIYTNQEKTVLDLASILSASKEIGIDNILSQKEEIEHLKAIMNFPADSQNVKKFAAKIKKLSIARNLYSHLDDIKKNMLDINGSETISAILSKVEDPIFHFTESLNQEPENQPFSVSDNIEEYIEYLIENPIDQVGISTGFPVYDQAIGGGLRKGTINVIAARPKTGKTLLADNMGFYIANKFKIPVLNMDTEMSKEDHFNRLIAMLSEIEMQKIETGKFNESNDLKNKVSKAVDQLKETPLYYKTIAGKPFDEQLSIMKRWLYKEVGLNSDGTAKDCVIFYDYLKLMDSSGISQDMKEYQMLGFMMSTLHNFAVKYKIPMVAFVQLNRDGITKESTDTASGSDRIIWLCSNFSIFKRKTDEEIAEDGPQNGNRKLLPVVSRHGGGLDDNDYINCHMQGWCAKISEGKTKLELSHGNNNTDGFDLNDNNDEQEEIPFL